MGLLLTNVRINQAFSAVLTCVFSPKNDLWGMLTQYTLTYKVFHSKVNDGVPERHVSIFKTGSETHLRRNAVF